MADGTRRAVIAIIAVAFLASPLAAQPDPFQRGPSEAGPMLDSVVVAVEANHEWKGFLLGSRAAHGFVDIALAGRPTTSAGRWGVALHAYGSAVDRVRRGSISSGHLGGRLVLSGYLDNSGESALSFVVDGYWLPEEDMETGGLELGLRLHGVEWSWGLPEVRPRVGVGVYRAHGRLDGLRSELEFDLEFGAQNLAFWGMNDVSVGIAMRGWWAEYKGPFAADNDLGGRIGGGPTFDWGLLEVVLEGGYLRTVDAAGRGYLEAYLRLWPFGGD